MDFFPLNKGKEKIIFKLLYDYREAAGQLSDLIFKSFEETGIFNKQIGDIKYSTYCYNLKIPNTVFVGAWYSNLTNQVLEQTKSWFSNLKNYINDFINDPLKQYEFKLENINHIKDEELKIKCLNELEENFKQVKIFNNLILGLTKDDKKILKKINNNLSWIYPNSKITDNENLKTLMKDIFNYFYKIRNKPKYKKFNISMRHEQTIKIDKIISNDKIKYIAEITTPYPNDDKTQKSKYKKLNICLNSFDHFEKIDGVLCKSIQINEYNNKLNFSLIKDEIIEDYKPITPHISIDLGLTTLFSIRANNKTYLFGNKLFNYLKCMDKILFGDKYNDKSNIGKIPYNSKFKSPKHENKDDKNLIKYKKNNKRIKINRTKIEEKIKNEINYNLNKIFNKFKPALIYKENVKFHDMNLSKRMNKILRNCGQKIINDRLDYWAKNYKIKIIEVNPAYTSQTCSSCGYPDKSNRKGKIFKCLFCGKKCDADSNASINIERRGIEYSNESQYVKKEVILKETVTKFIKINNIPRCSIKNNYFKNIERLDG